MIVLVRSSLEGKDHRNQGIKQIQDHLARHLITKEDSILIQKTKVVLDLARMILTQFMIAKKIQFLRIRKWAETKTMF